MIDDSTRHSSIRKTPWGKIIIGGVVLSVAVTFIGYLFAWTVFFDESSKLYNAAISQSDNLIKWARLLSNPDIYPTLAASLSDHGAWTALLSRLLLPPVIGISLFIMYFKGIYRKNGRYGITIVKGSDRFEGRRAIAAARYVMRKKAITNIRKFLPRLRARFFASAIQWGVRVHPKIKIPYGTETKNFLWAGTIGSGKTTTMLPLLKEWDQRGTDRMFIYAKKQELVEYFFDKHAHMFAPTDNRGSAWNIAADCQTEQDAYTVAERFIPVPTNGDPMWSLAAQQILTGLIIALMSECPPVYKIFKTKGKVVKRKVFGWGWRELYAQLELDEEEILRLMEKYYPAAKSYIQENSPTTQGFMVNIKAYCGFIRVLAKAWSDSTHPTRSLSLTQFIEAKKTPNKRKLIVAMNTKYWNLSCAIASTVLTFLGRTHQSLTDDNTRRIIYSLDECGTFKCPELPDFMSDLRGRGGVFALGIQDRAQLEDLYGERPAQTMIGLCNTVYGLRVSGDTGEWLSKEFGEYTFIEHKVSTSGGNKNASDEKQRESVVNPEEFTELPNPEDIGGVEGFLMVKGAPAIYKLKWNFGDVKIPKVAKPYVKAKWLSDEAAKFLLTAEERAVKAEETGSASSGSKGKPKSKPEQPSAVNNTPDPIADFAQRAIDTVNGKTVETTVSNGTQQVVETRQKTNSSSIPIESPTALGASEMIENQVLGALGIDGGLIDVGIEALEIAGMTSAQSKDTQTKVTSKKTTKKVTKKVAKKRKPTRVL